VSSLILEVVTSKQKVTDKAAKVETMVRVINSMIVSKERPSTNPIGNPNPCSQLGLARIDSPILTHMVRENSLSSVHSFMKEIPSLMLDFLHLSDNLPGLSQRTHLWIEEVSGRGI
jgi:hypothetical protein